MLCSKRTFPIALANVFLTGKDMKTIKLKINLNVNRKHSDYALCDYMAIMPNCSCFKSMFPEK